MTKEAPRHCGCGLAFLDCLKQVFFKIVKAEFGWISKGPTAPLLLWPLELLYFSIVHLAFSRICQPQFLQSFQHHMVCTAKTVYFKGISQQADQPGCQLTILRYLTFNYLNLLVNHLKHLYCTFHAGLVNHCSFSPHHY